MIQLSISEGDMLHIEIDGVGKHFIVKFGKDIFDRPEINGTDITGNHTLKIEHGRKLPSTQPPLKNS